MDYQYVSFYGKFVEILIEYMKIFYKGIDDYVITFEVEYLASDR